MVAAIAKKVQVLYYEVQTDGKNINIH